MTLHDENREKSQLFEKYGFEHFTDQSSNPLQRLNWAFYKALNSTNYMPSIVVYFLDDDIFTAPELFIPSEIESQLCWIFQDFAATLRERRRDMPLRSLNTLKNLPHFDNGSDSSILIFQDRLQKFNNLLQAIGRCFSVGTINIQTITEHDSGCFDKSNTRQLDTRGHYRLWRELLKTLSDIAQDIERDRRKRVLQEEVHIRDRSQHNHSDSHYRHHDNNRRSKERY